METLSTPSWAAREHLQVRSQGKGEHNGVSGEEPPVNVKLHFDDTDVIRR